MEQSLDSFFLKIPEPQQSALLFLRQFFIEELSLEENWKFNTPFYYYQGKWFCYISYSAKRKHEIYIGFVKGFLVEHPYLLSEGRKQIKVYRINPEKDIDIKTLKKIVGLLKKQY
ncbi:MAG: DUF1801 domain-containing protein [Bacteroidia bacterium]